MTSLNSNLKSSIHICHVLNGNRFRYLYIHIALSVTFFPNTTVFLIYSVSFLFKMLCFDSITSVNGIEYCKTMPTTVYNVFVCVLYIIVMFSSISGEVSGWLKVSSSSNISIFKETQYHRKTYMWTFFEIKLLNLFLERSF